MPDERSSDTDETFGSQSPPGSVSSQNNEEGDAPAGGSQQGGGEGDRQGSGDGRPEQQRPSEQSTEGTVGGAGEGSQATGNPKNAG